MMHAGDLTKGIKQNNIVVTGGECAYKAIGVLALEPPATIIQRKTKILLNVWSNHIFLSLIPLSAVAIELINQ